MLNKATKIGEACYQSHFDKGGVETRIKMDPREYHDMCCFGSVPPEGYSAFAKPVFDTPSGDLEDGYYTENPDGTFSVKLVGCFEVLIKPSDLVKGVLDPAVESALKDYSALYQKALEEVDLNLSKERVLNASALTP